MADQEGYFYYTNQGSDQQSFEDFLNDITHNPEQETQHCMDEPGNEQEGGGNDDYRASADQSQYFVAPERNQTFRASLPFNPKNVSYQQVTYANYGYSPQQTNATAGSIPKARAESLLSTQSYGDPSTSQNGSFSTPSNSSEEVHQQWAADVEMGPSAGDYMARSQQDAMLRGISYPYLPVRAQEHPFQGYVGQLPIHNPDQSYGSLPLTLPDASTGPWTHLDATLADLNVPGLATVGEAHVPVDSTASDHLRQNLQHDNQRLTSRTNVPARNAKKKGKVRAVEGWERIAGVAVRRGLLPIIETSEPRRGRRNGPFAEQKKKRINEMRKQGACFICQLRKVECNNASTCQNCLKRKQVCLRQFTLFVPTLFPDILCSHLGQTAVENFTNQHVCIYYGDVFDVEVSLGASFDTLQLPVICFMQNDGSDVHIHDHLQAGTLVHTYSTLVSLPLATGKSFHEALEPYTDILEPYMRSLASSPSYVDQATEADSSLLPKVFMRAAFRYCLVARSQTGHSDDDTSSPAENAMALHASFYAMRTILTFSEASAIIMGSANGSSSTSSRLLNRQLKSALQEVSKSFAHMSFSGLEKSLRSRNATHWGASFCAMIVLCLCLENLQMSADMFAAFAPFNFGLAGKWSRDHSRKACRDIEKNAFEKLTELFHEAFKSKGARKDAFNPLRALYEGKGISNLDQATTEMLMSICSIIRNYDIRKLAGHPLLANLPDHDDPRLVASAKIKENGEGRLVARFLCSFYE